MLLEPHEDPRGQIAELYEESDRYDVDACEWFAVAPDQPAHIVDAIREWYGTTDRASMVIDDLYDGADTL